MITSLCEEEECIALRDKTNPIGLYRGDKNDLDEERYRGRGP